MSQQAPAQRATATAMLRGSAWRLMRWLFAALLIASAGPAAAASSSAVGDATGDVQHDVLLSMFLPDAGLDAAEAEYDLTEVAILVNDTHMSLRFRVARAPLEAAGPVYGAVVFVETYDLRPMPSRDTKLHVTMQATNGSYAASAVFWNGEGRVAAPVSIDGRQLTASFPFADLGIAAGDLLKMPLACASDAPDCTLSGARRPVDGAGPDEGAPVPVVVVPGDPQPYWAEPEVVTFEHEKVRAAQWVGAGFLVVSVLLYFGVRRLKT